MKLRVRDICQGSVQYPQQGRRDAPRAVLLCLALVLTCTCAACVASRPPLQGLTPQAEPTVPTVRVFIVVHRWHSGVALPRAALPRAILPEVTDFPDADYLEFGWGIEIITRASGERG